MKKRILSEGNVRRMMKLANIGTLTESFIEETEELEENGEGEYFDEAYESDDTSLTEQEMEDEEMGMDPEMGDEDLDLGDEEGDEDLDLGDEEEEGDIDADDLSDFLEFINDKVEDYAEMKGIDLEVEFEEEGEEDEEELEGLEDELGDLEGPEGEPGDEEMDMEPEMGGEEEEAGPMMESLRREIEGSLSAAGFYMEEDIETNLINEVTRRVAHRLLMARARKG